MILDRQAFTAGWQHELKKQAFVQSLVPALAAPVLAGIAMKPLMQPVNGALNLQHRGQDALHNQGSNMLRSAGSLSGANPYSTVATKRILR